MGILDDAIRQHLDLKRRQGAADDELARLEDEAFGPPSRPDDPDFPDTHSEQIVDPGGEGATSPAVAGAAVENGAVAAQVEPPPAPVDQPPAPVEQAPPSEEDESAPPVVEEPPAPEQEPEPPVEEQPAPQENEPAQLVEEPLIEPHDTSEHPDLSAPLLPETGEHPHEPPVESLDTAEHPFEGAVEDTGEAEVVEGELEEPPVSGDPLAEDEDVLEETPEFLRDQPEDDELWFEQGEPKDFDF